MSIGDSSYIPSADEAQELIDRLNEITDWHIAFARSLRPAESSFSVPE
jgi:hypothetical protein